MSVERSLNQLQESISRIREVADLDMAPGELRSLYIDVRSNSVVMGVGDLDMARVQAKLSARGVNPSAIRMEAVEIVQPSAAVRGADGTRNLTYQQQQGQVRPCSVGASIVGGYITAAHCGYTNDQITTPSGHALGYTAESYWDTSTQLDSAWVSTYTGWEPKPEVNGYTDGIITVPAIWSGNAEAPVGSTVCRYGQTSGGPDCGTIEALNLLIYLWGSGYIDGVTRASGICSDDGDSGGTHMSPAGQIQGTHIGGEQTNICPTPTTVYFQPIQDSLNAFSKIMLTAHGAAAPSISGFKCPDLDNSGDGIYSCHISYYNSQGSTSKSWSSNTGSSSTGLELWGSCVGGSTVTVNLAVTNPYGTSNRAASFACPMNPMP